MEENAAKNEVSVMVDGASVMVNEASVVVDGQV